MSSTGSAEALAAASSGASARGELFLYNEELGYAAFECGAGHGPRALVCLGGLTDGLLSLRYLPALAQALAEDGWRVVQPVLQSSYSGWGIGSLDQDAADLDTLLEFLALHRGISEVALLGHSTGCQDVVRYLAFGKRASMVQAAILQAPVSDREALALTSINFSLDAAAALQKYRQMASSMIAEGHGDEVMPRAACLLLGPPHAITASRFDSLTGRMTQDDMFSSDLTDAELQQCLGHVAVPTLIAMSLDDEYVPSSVDARALAARLRSAMAIAAVGSAEVLAIREGGHALRHPAGKEEFVAGLKTFLGTLPGRARLTWEVEMAKDLRERAARSPPGRPLMVAVVGMPGAGKSTAGRALERLLGPSCLVLPMDGFHLPLAALRARPDAADAIYRRGAPDTFDPAALCERLGEICGDTAAAPEEVRLPGFDHAVGDPTEDAFVFDRRRHRIVIVEGLYLLHEGDGWEGTRNFFDYRIYIDADLQACIAQVKERNKCIPGWTAEAMAARVEIVDHNNANTVHASKGRADVVVPSGAASPKG